MGHAESPEPQPPRPAGIPRWLAIALAPIVGDVGFSSRFDIGQGGESNPGCALSSRRITTQLTCRRG